MVDGEQDNQENRNAERLASLEAGKDNPTSTGAARLKAMRKKRFAKRSAKTEELAKADETAVKAESSTSAEKMEKTDEKNAEVEVADQPVVNQEGEAEAEEIALPTDKKKYKGVAAIRRQRIIEKRLKEADKPEKAELLGTMPKKQRDLSGYYELLVLIIIFMAGFLIGGMQHESVVVKAGLNYLNPPETVVRVPHVLNGLDYSSEDDEFDVEVEEVGEIDPIFGVDLDKLVEGDDILRKLAKVAVKIHRSIISFPLAILKNPPVLLIVSIFLRKLIKIPKAVQNKQENSNMIMAYLIGFFPLLSSILNLYRRTRKDVGVMFVGLLLGLLVAKGRVTDEL
mmetsp:Transcript_16071/g.23658  ORF Transcript_16071/g.23658 Transcript_16071/m.23658 type:complete len:340 (-) Transcript_16071:97-1116(-)|eukprot:CAMPEP_0116019740 /NCGR_PEP_ID=MMETSP0321-20121206/9407_1 /TAXON_ID=163516 /ORGANISM="Leptocylindrus danicus var. danicus, Strain B650" /LENGTH=339 /DNA_ID=CAMNT_0003490349 /DNA_START=24 /DNA_END=1043 /DNA_ORIENTATION=-